MSNPDNYVIVKAPSRDRVRGVVGTSLNLRKRGAANWSLSIPDAAFDSGDSTWEESLTAAVKRPTRIRAGTGCAPPIMRCPVEIPVTTTPGDAELVRYHAGAARR